MGTPVLSDLRPHVELSTLGQLLGGSFPSASPAVAVRARAAPTNDTVSSSRANLALPDKAYRQYRLFTSNWFSRRQRTLAVVPSRAPLCPIRG